MMLKFVGILIQKIQFKAALRQDMKYGEAILPFYMQAHVEEFVVLKHSR